MFLHLNLPKVNPFISFSPTFNTHTIEISYRKFFLTVLKTFSNEQWRSMNITYESLKGGMDSIDWNITWQIFHDVKGFWYKLMKMSKWWTFLLKCFMKLLPLGNICLNRKPALYKDLNCPACNNPDVIEDWDHLFNCATYHET